MFFITSFGMPTWGDDNDGDCIWIVCGGNGCCADGVDGFTRGLDGDWDIVVIGKGGGGGNGVSFILFWFNYWIEVIKKIKY